MWSGRRARCSSPTPRLTGYATRCDISHDGYEHTHHEHDEPSARSMRPTTVDALMTLITEPLRYEFFRQGLPGVGAGRSRCAGCSASTSSCGA